MEKSSQRKIENLFEQWVAEYLNDHEELLSFVPEQVYEQVEFIGNYLVAILMELPQNQHLAWAEQFFSLQKAGLDEDNLEFQFSGDMYDTCLFVRDVSKIDLSVVHDLTEFGTIAISRGDGKKWSIKDAEAMINDVRNDLEFDFGNVSLEYIIKKNSLQVSCHVKEN